MLSHLNSPQREAVKYLDGPLLVLAGAGSGKTRVITQKIAYLIQQCGYLPREIAAITFTNKAANEMKERVSQLLVNESSKGLTVATFHSLGMQILRQEAKVLGYKPQFSILDSADSYKILADILATTDKQLLRKTQWQISAWKNALISPDRAKAESVEELTHASAKIYQLYQQTLRAYQAVDFDDLIKLPVELFDAHTDILDKWQRKLKYLLIDEYQDTNACQYMQRQGRVPATDTATPGHSLLDLGLSRRFAVGERDALAFVKLSNAGDALAFNATTIASVRELSPLPGRAIKAGLRVEF